MFRKHYDYFKIFKNVCFPDIILITDRVRSPPTHFKKNITFLYLTILTKSGGEYLSHWFKENSLVLGVLCFIIFQRETNHNILFYIFIPYFSFPNLIKNDIHFYSNDFIKKIMK